MRRNRSIESSDSESDTRKSKQFGNHLQPMSVSRPQTQRKLSCEEIINEMEKEQDAMVVRLLRELERVKEENVHLRKQLALGQNRDSSDRELSGAEEYESNYHYSSSEYSSSSRNSLASRARRPSSMSQSLSGELPAQSIHNKRMSSVVGPGAASSTVLLNDERHRASDVDPRLAVPRGWSVSDEAPSRRIEAGDGTRRLQEYRLK